MYTRLHNRRPYLGSGNIGGGRNCGLGIGNAFPFFFSASNLSILSFRKYRSYMHIYIYQNHPYPTIHPHIPTSPNLDNPLELFTPQANRAIPRTLKSSILTDIRTPHLSLLFLLLYIQLHQHQFPTEQTQPPSQLFAIQPTLSTSTPSIPNPRKRFGGGQSKPPHPHGRRAIDPLCGARRFPPSLNICVPFISVPKP